MTPHQTMLLCTSAAASAFNLAPEALHSRSQQHHLSFARYIAIYLARERFGLSARDSSIHFGFKSRSSAVKAILAVRAALDTNDRERAPKIRLAERALEALMEDAA